MTQTGILTYDDIRYVVLREQEYCDLKDGTGKTDSDVRNIRIRALEKERAEALAKVSSLEKEMQKLRADLTDASAENWKLEERAQAAKAEASRMYRECADQALGKRVYTAESERDEALAKAAAWEKARDAERDTVQRLQEELIEWSTWAEDQRKYERRLRGKLRRARKKIKRLQAEVG